MLTNRSREEILPVKAEIKSFETGLVDAKKLEEEFNTMHIHSEDLLMRGKGFLMEPEIERLSRLLDDCDHWFCETSTDSNSIDIMHNLCKYCAETDSESTDDDDVDYGTETEDGLDESDVRSTDDDDVD